MNTQKFACATALGVIALCLVACGVARSAELREWSDKSGKFRIEAKIVTVKEGKAYLEKADGSVITVPLEKLSKADVDHLKSLPEFKERLGGDAADEENPFEAAGEPSSTAGDGEIKFAEVGGNRDGSGEVMRFREQGWGVKSLAFSPDGRFLAVGKSDSTLMVYDVTTEDRVSFHDKLAGLGDVTALAFTPDGKFLLSGGGKGRISVWSVRDSGILKEVDQFVGHRQEVNSITISKNGKYALSGGKEKGVRYWSLDGGQEVFSIGGFKGDVKATFLTPNGKQGLACDGETLALIDLEKQKVVQTMRLANSSAQTAGISPSGSHVFAHDTYAIRVWDIRTGKEQLPLQDREIQWSGAFSPNGKYLISGGQGKINLWEVKTNRKMREFDASGTYYVQTLAFSPDGRHFAAIPGSAGQDLQVFRLPPDVDASIEKSIEKSMEKSKEKSTSGAAKPARP